MQQPCRTLLGMSPYWFPLDYYEKTLRYYYLQEHVRLSYNSGEFDYLFICHSQGCNTLMSVLKRGCSQ